MSREEQQAFSYHREAVRDAEIQISILAGLVDIEKGNDVMLYDDEDSDDNMDDIGSLNTEEQAILISHGNSDANKDSLIMFQ